MSPKVSKKKPKATTAVADPSEATRNRILEILRERGRMKVRGLAESLGETTDELRPILMNELSELIGLTEKEDEENEDGEWQPEPQQEAYLRLTAAEVDRRSVLEVDIESGQRKSAVAHREIHQNRLYRDYGSYEDYCQNRWHHGRQWGYELMRWLAVVEALEAAGMKDYRLGIGDANELYHLRECPSEYVAALQAAEQQAKKEGVLRTREHLRQAVEVRQGFVQLAKEFPDLTWEEYSSLRSLPKCERTMQRFQTVQDCATAKCIPYDTSLLKHCRGQELADLVAQLKPVASAIAELKDLEAQQEYMDKDARTERKVIHDRMAEVKRALEAAPAASGQTTTSSAQTAAGPAPSSPGSNRGLIIGSYDIACDGECFDNIKVPRSPMIMEELTDFLQDIDRMVTREEVYGDWSVLVTPHKFDEKKSDDGETDKDSSKDGNK